jgi:hypothetical protein
VPINLQNFTSMRRADIAKFVGDDPRSIRAIEELQRLLGEAIPTAVDANEAAITALQNRNLIAGAGLTGGGDLTADRTFNVGAGTGITVGADTVSIDLTAEAERIRDIMGIALVAGSNITITVNDPGDTITIACSLSAYTDEQAQDAVGSILTDTATIDFTYNDAANTISADVKAASIGTTQLTDGGVTLAKQANMATASVVYRKTAGSGAPEVQTLSTLKTDLGLTGTNSGDQTITLSGDASGSGTGAITVTIAAGAVTLAKMANLAANSILGNNTGSGATPIALTGTQTTAMLDVFSSSLKGLAPASGGGTSNFLRADGTWAAPSASSGSNWIPLASGAEPLSFISDGAGSPLLVAGPP